MKREFFGGMDRPGISTVMVEAFNIMQDRITRARLAGDPPDVLIAPRVGKVGLFDFHRASEAIEIAAEVMMAQRSSRRLRPTEAPVSATASSTRRTLPAMMSFISFSMSL